MDEKTLMEIESRVRAANTSAQSAGLLRTLVKDELSVLREGFARARQKEKLDGCDRWLSDNFYALEGHAKQSIPETKCPRSESAGCLRLYLTVSAVFSDDRIAVTEDNIAAVLGAMNGTCELRESQLAFTRTAMRCALLSLAARAVQETGSDVTTAPAKDMVSRKDEGDITNVCASGTAAQNPDGDSTVAQSCGSIDGEFSSDGSPTFGFPSGGSSAVDSRDSGSQSGGLSPAERERQLSFAVISLNALGGLDFDALICRCSAVEAVFLRDPSGVYPKMAEQSRAHYRGVTARIARHSKVTESEVAREMLLLAQKAEAELERHVGFYLMSRDPQTRRARRRGTVAVVLSWVLPLIICGLYAFSSRGIFTALIVYLPLVEITRIIACALAMRGMPAAHIPRMELTENVPKTVIAVSTLLPPAAKADELRERLEQLYFSNRSDNLYFCLLADFREDKRPYNPQDEVNAAAAQQVVEQLNARYGRRFMLYLRRRSYNETQERYIGWERKRGAVTEFIRFIKGGETSVRCFVGDLDALKNLRYLIALDADTGIAFDMAGTLVSAAVHPLNRPVIDKQNIVSRGYGIIVPCLETDISAALASDFTRIMAGAGGISSYERECSDFYQDMFGEAIFSGKGLIDIDAFHTVLNRRFPENAVLSHDILEGAYLRVGLLSDATMSDGMPTNAVSWFTRMHRWLRGDWQNIIFLRREIKAGGIVKPNPISRLSRYKLCDNLRRSLVPVAAVAGVVAACFTDAKTSLALCAIAVLSVSLAPLLGALRTLVSGGSFALSRRYFARTLPRVFELLAQAALAFVMAAQQTVVTLDAIIRTVFRLTRSHKNLLEWTTAEQGETRDTGFFSVLRRSWISETAGLLVLIFAPASYFAVKLAGLMFMLYAPITAATARKSGKSRQQPTRAQRDRLVSWCAQMFGYYEDHANEENNFLPPDNIQLSPTGAVARRTSPTNIGMMLLSFLAARDLHIIDSAGLFLRVSRTLDTIESLETYHGNLFNWYSTENLKILPDYFVSAVDSGNYLCSLVAVKEGLYEYSAGEPQLGMAAARIEVLLAAADFSVFYDNRRKLLTIGLDQNGVPNGSHYDFLMSEARTASYYAVATRQAGRRHWRALNRTMSRSGVYAGPVSWTGTMFEYFMPHLLLPAYEGSLLREALDYAIYCQKARAAKAGVPWGISESGYFAFDEHLNYQYKAHGVQTLGVKQGLERDCVVSPYSTFLTLPFELDAGIKNLERLEKLGMTGRYGFFEAIDFTPGRCGAGGEIVRSYMAHHVGMSLVACDNVLLGNVMQRRFMRDHAMRSAREFLQEKISKDTVVYERMKFTGDARRAAEPKPITVGTAVEPLSPECTLLSGGELTHVFSDSGISWLRFADLDVTRRSDDPLMHGQGIISVVRMNGETISPTAAPFWQAGIERRCEFSRTSVAYHAQKGSIGMTQRFLVDKTRPVERCALTVKNLSPVKAMAQILFYFEPILAVNSDYAAHPAFSKLFLTGKRDLETDSIIFSRESKSGGDGLNLAAGFADRRDYEFSLRREEVTPYPDGMGRLLEFSQLAFDGGEATPDGCCAVRCSITIPPNGEETVTLLLSCAVTQEECAGNLAAARAESAVEVESASSPLVDEAMEARLGMRILPQIVLGRGLGERQIKALAENIRGRDALWSLGISGDLPIVVYDWTETEQQDMARLDAYVGFWRIMRMCRLDFDLCVIGKPPKGMPDGVKTVDPAQCREQVLTALRAAACHLAGERPGMPPSRAGWRPASVLDVIMCAPPKTDKCFDVVGGTFCGGRFYVDRVTPLPFSHILANEEIGCLLNDASLGNTWWKNSRECKLTPWRNDIATGNDGERLLLSCADGIYDLCRSAKASFSPADARYEGLAGTVKTSVRVGLDGRAKILDIELYNDRDEEAEVICAYYIEPVLGVSRQTAKFTQFCHEDGCLMLHNPYQTELPCHAAVYVPGEYPSYTTDRAAFLAGDWSAVELMPNDDPIAGTVVRRRLPPRRRERIRFILAVAEERSAAIAAAKHAAVAPSRFAPSCAKLTIPTASSGVRGKLGDEHAAGASAAAVTSVETETDAADKAVTSPDENAANAQAATGGEITNTAPTATTLETTTGAENTAVTSLADTTKNAQAAMLGEAALRSMVTSPETADDAMIDAASTKVTPPAEATATSQTEMASCKAASDATNAKVTSPAEATATSQANMMGETARLIETAPSARVITVSTPNEPLNCLINGFAPHQIKAGRLMGRCGFYQCSGAYGFRDQLQDVGALLMLEPELAKKQIERCCAVQFSEGDVLHWWHSLPSETRGVRTRFSDDLVWLPLTVCDYVETTGDTAILEREIPYCLGDALAQDEQERYMEVTPSKSTGSVYDHCIRAIDHAYNLGDRGIPKIGSGDWNDGFSKVGEGGQGQSVWLGMFLAMTLDKFAPLCEICGDRFRASVYRGYASALRHNIDKNCWDGRWYLRAFYDSGGAIGGGASDECRIDLLSQSFSALADMPDKERINSALDSAAARLVDDKWRIIKLFSPPFERSKTDSAANDPGYIKSYPAGIRENGGQYTHGAIWLALAMIKAGRRDEGWRLLDMLNPVSRCTDARLARAYKLEPYYIAADIYTNPGAYGHGGWSIYTGAAGWYYRAVMETLLGLKFSAEGIALSPNVPDGWNAFSVTIQDGGAQIELAAKRSGRAGLKVDGVPAVKIPLDGKSHMVEATF